MSNEVSEQNVEGSVYIEDVVESLFNQPIGSTATYTTEDGVAQTFERTGEDQITASDGAGSWFTHTFDQVREIAASFREERLIWDIVDELAKLPEFTVTNEIEER
jgi:hypothetical protein